MERAGDMGDSVDALDGLVESAASSHLVLGMTGFPRLGLLLGSDGASDRVAVLEEGEGCGGPYETCDLMHASSGVSMSGSEWTRGRERGGGTHSCDENVNHLVCVFCGFVLDTGYKRIRRL